MSWFGAAFADALVGAARRIFDRVLAPARRARQDWQTQYVVAERAVAQQRMVVEQRIVQSQRTLTLAEATVLHRQSAQAADLAHEAFKMAHLALDALGESIVETAKQRKMLEQRARGSTGLTRREYQAEIDSLHRLRDQFLVPDKDRVKAEKNRLLAEVRRLNSATAQLREIKADHRRALPAVRVPASVKWFDLSRGFGFLLLNDGRELYVSARQVSAGLILTPGLVVRCEIRSHPDGKSSAANVARW